MNALLKHTPGVLRYSLIASWLSLMGVIVFGGLALCLFDANEEFWGTVFDIPSVIIIAPGVAVYALLAIIGLRGVLAAIPIIASIPLFWGTVIYACLLYRRRKDPVSAS
jgi:hypothetical protein